MKRALLLLLCIGTLFQKASAQCNNVNLAELRPQSAAFGSTTGNLIEPYRAFDGGDNAGVSRWSATDMGLTHYIGIDLGQAYNICTVYIEFGSLDYPTNMKLQGSNDTTAGWTDLRTLPNNTQYMVTFDNLPTTGTYRFVRALLLDRANSSWTYYNVYRFEIYNRVPNDPPTVNLTAPVNGASYITGTNIDFTATASDINGTVSKVQFYHGDTLIGEDLSSPYSVTWMNVPAGRYPIKAKAIDNGGASTWTDSININVSNAPTYLRNWNLNGNNVNNTNSGYVAIGAVPVNMPSNDSIKLSVGGTIFAKKLTVTTSLWSDFVFDAAYTLKPLSELESYIGQNKHLPGIPSTAEVLQNGVNVGQNQVLLLQKVEELTLYLIEQDKKIKQLQKKTAAQARELKKLSGR